MVVPAALGENLGRRAVVQVREVAGMFGGEGERIEIMLKTEQTQGAQVGVAISPVAALEAVNHRHGIAGGAQTDIPDDQFFRVCRFLTSRAARADCSM